MAPIRNAQVASGIITTGTSKLVYQVPASHAFLLKSVLLLNTGAAAATVQISITDYQSGAELYIISQSISTNQAAVWSGWTALNASNAIAIYTTGVPVRYWIAGALLPYNAALSGVLQATSPAELPLAAPPETPSAAPLLGPPTIYLPPNTSPAYVAGV